MGGSGRFVFWLGFSASDDTGPLHDCRGSVSSGMNECDWAQVGCPVGVGVRVWKILAGCDCLVDRSLTVTAQFFLLSVAVALVPTSG